MTGGAKELSLETLAGIAEQGGASDELAAIQFSSVQSSVPKRVEISESINPPNDSPSPVEKA
ncbi:MAG: hypothetical protein ACD_48C00619G0002 [uncultured bacterium]|uniref:Uncharacterized protein n=1 Tax=Candidatus Gottesmanbacteria bacterium RIFCSPLOWO2_01_FULL_43_11b TaxID=1798392 RepID=A0A1F6AGE9_9BACT|nr:MAG: hypothetical protein ACD_48C00619G0002 [uncultured bacterium]OGG23830.1 MAG: hypothetical protein A3A79_01330 [Candidatus Gottesmanbacteria bacterium RIFCSPLOWO2_01_FULL_43_11b]